MTNKGTREFPSADAVRILNGLFLLETQAMKHLRTCEEAVVRGSEITTKKDVEHWEAELGRVRNLQDAFKSVYKVNVEYF